MSQPAFVLPRRAVAALLAAGASAIALPAGAQGAEPYPAKPLTWVVGYPPGGSVDAITRLLARKLEPLLGQGVVVDNRPGATGAIALRAVAKAPADGYTLITVPGPVLTNTPMPTVGDELVPVSMLARSATILVGPARPGAPRDLKALIAEAKAHPDKYSYASSGNGTGQHLMGELLNAIAGTKIVHVPYKGGGQAVTDVVGGQIPLAVLGITPVLTHIKSGKLIAYGVSTGTRSPSLPEVPTLQEAGLSRFDASQWFLAAAPKGMPADRIARLNAAIGRVLKDSEVVDSFARQGLVPEAASPQQAAAFVEADLKRWRDLAREAKLPLD